MSNGLLLWVDDEIELLKAHIIFLEKKGYEVNCISKARIEVSFRNTVGVTHTCHDNEEYLFEVNFCPVCGKKMKKV